MPSNQTIRPSALVVRRHADDRLDVRLQQVRSADLVEAGQGQVEHGQLLRSVAASAGRSHRRVASQTALRTSRSSRPGPAAGQPSSARTGSTQPRRRPSATASPPRAGLSLTYTSSSRPRTGRSPPPLTQRLPGNAGPVANRRLPAARRSARRSLAYSFGSVPE